MSEVLSLSSGKYKKSGKISIDGMIWDVKLPGANSELRLSQVQRESKMLEARMKLLTDKIDSGSFDEKDLQLYEKTSLSMAECEKFMVDFFLSYFADSTDDNREVKKWLNETPLAIIFQQFEDIRDQANGDNGNGQDQSQSSQS